MAYSDNFPATRPVFQADFANGGRIDPRATFSRADTPPTYAAPSAVHYWSNEKHLSSENLLLQSSDLNTSWTNQGLTSITGGQTDPSGGTDGFTLLENTATSYHRVDQSMSASGELAFVVYAKRKSGTRYLNLALYTPANSQSAGLATFDLSGGATHTSNGSSSTLTNLSATQTESGNGYYKCVFKATGSGPTYVSIGFSDVAAPVANDFGLVSYTGDGSSSIDVAFASLSTTGATDYNATTTSIHRQYAPSLKSVATAGQPRFEYDPSTDGQSVGILIEGSATNLLNRSEEFDNAYWSKGRTTVQPNAAVSPAGDLTADLITANATGASETHYAAKVFSFTSGTTYTLSVYAKAAGLTQLTLQAGNTATWDASVQFTLTGDGSTSVSSGSAAIERCGNGWYRCSITGDAAASASTNVLFKLVSGGSDSFDGDDYSGALLWGAQLETGAASSYIKVEGSTATRASESLSVATADIGYTGGPVSIVAEGEGGRGDYPRLFSMGDSSSYLTFFRLSSAASASTAYKFWVNDSGVRQADLNEEASVTRVAVSVDTDSVKSCGNGGAVQSDTAAVMPVLSTTLQIGDQPTGGKQWNGHIKRLAIYSEPLSSTNLQALTS